MFLYNPRSLVLKSNYLLGILHLISCLGNVSHFRQKLVELLSLDTNPCIISLERSIHNLLDNINYNDNFYQNIAHLVHINDLLKINRIDISAIEHKINSFSQAQQLNEDYIVITQIQDDHELVALIKEAAHE